MGSAVESLEHNILYKSIICDREVVLVTWRIRKLAFSFIQINFLVH